MLASGYIGSCAITITSRAFIAAARIRTNADFGGIEVGFGMEGLRYRFSSALVSRHDFGGEGWICQAELMEAISKFDSQIDEMRRNITHQEVTW